MNLQRNENLKGKDLARFDMIKTTNHLEYLLSLTRIELSVFLKQFLVCYSFDKNISLQEVKKMEEQLKKTQSFLKKNRKLYKRILESDDKV